jgi:DNA-binding PadR family transcriptional regulator
MGARVATGTGVAASERGAAMRSPLNWALLGLVIQRPSYGYELVQRFERAYEDTLELSSPSQIYTGLDALARRALIEQLPGDGAPGIVRQPKPHYRATAAGVHGYQEWLIGYVEDERRCSRLFARQLAALAPAAGLAVIERCEQDCLRAARATAAPPGQPGQAQGLAERLVLEQDRLSLESKLAWIEYARRELTALTAGTRSSATAS